MTVKTRILPISPGIAAMMLATIALAFSGPALAQRGPKKCRGVDCDDGNACTIDKCLPKNGQCQHTPVDDGTECIVDGVDGMCMDGMCEGSQPGPVTDQGVNDYLHPLPAAEIPAVFVHVNVNNNDFFNMRNTNGPMILRWHVLQREGQGPFATPGAISPFAAILHPDGVHVWGASAEGAGFPMVHRVNRFTGEIDFQTEPFDPLRPGDMPGPFVAFNYFVYDAEGNVYIMDDLHVYSWDADANLRWKTPLPTVTMPDGTEQTIQRPWIGSPIITTEGFIGSATNDGFWLFLDLEDGSVVIAEPYLPTQAVECEPAVQLIGLLVSLTVPEFAPSVGAEGTCIAFGRGVKITETTGYHAESGTIIQNNGNADGTSSRLAGFRIVDKPGAPGEKTMETLWTNEDLPSGGATSPSITLDGTSVVVADGEAKFRSFNVQDGTLEWVSTEEGEAALSPAMDEEGNLVAANRRNLLKFAGSGSDPGSVIFNQNYDFVADGIVPARRPFPLLVPDGTPKANLLSVQMTGPDDFITAPSIGYVIANPGFFFPTLEVEMYSTQIAGYMRTNADTGELIPESFGTINLNGGSYDTSIMNTVDGWITGQVTDVFGLIFELTLERFVPRRFKSPGPRFGIYAMETSDHQGNACNRIEGILQWNDEAVPNLRTNPQRSFDLVRRGVPALKEEAIPTEVSDAARQGQISDATALGTRRALAEARPSQRQAKVQLLGGSPPTDVFDSIERANAALVEAARRLGCD